MNTKSDMLSMVKVEELLSEKSFYIRNYQRGYRWRKDEVKALLNDIKEFYEKHKGDEGQCYCLQPIVVLNDDEQKRYNVIDGQQRLTTLYLILKFLGESPYTIEYETRKDSKDFLEKIANEEDESSINSIDFLYMKEAYEAIKSWFGNDKELQEELKRCILKKVEVIWYTVNEKYEEEVFRRLNSQKIPLTNAELIKALFLIREEGQESITEKQKIIALEWDIIEKRLQDDMFWYFIKEGDIKDKAQEASRINYIFDLMSKKGENEADEFYTFKKFSGVLVNGNEKVEDEYSWDKVKEYFGEFENWYEDRELYHYIGFLIANGEKLGSIQEKCKEKQKSEIKKVLKQEIITKIFKKNTDLNEEIGILSYSNKNERKKIARILLLFNICTILKDKTVDSRYPFHLHRKEKWSLEHIHARNPEDMKTKDRKVLLNAYQEFFESYKEFFREENLIEKVTERIDEIDRYLKSENNSESKVFSDIYKSIKKLEQELEGRTTQNEDDSLVDGIGNLALLDNRNNSSFKNAPFYIKRKRLIDSLKGERSYIPLCTQYVFFKYYTSQFEKSQHSYNLWTQQNREDYTKAIVETISSFIQGEESNV